MAKYGTGSDLQQGLQAATAAIQGLAGGDLKAAIAGGAAPYLAEVVKNMTTNADHSVNVAANAMAHAVVGAVVAQLQGNGALAGAAGAAGGELAARLIAEQLFPGVRPEELTESQKQTVSVLGTLAAGLAGGLAAWREPARQTPLRVRRPGRMRWRIISLEGMKNRKSSSCRRTRRT